MSYRIEVREGRTWVDAGWTDEGTDGEVHAVRFPTRDAGSGAIAEFVASTPNGHAASDYRVVPASSRGAVVLDVREERTHEARPYFWVVVHDAATRAEIATFIQDTEAVAREEALQYCGEHGLSVQENFEEDEDASEEEVNPYRP